MAKVTDVLFRHVDRLGSHYDAVALLDVLGDGRIGLDFDVAEVEHILTLRIGVLIIVSHLVLVFVLHVGPDFCAQSGVV